LIVCIFVLAGIYTYVYMERVRLLGWGDEQPFTQVYHIMINQHNHLPLSGFCGLFWMDMLYFPVNFWKRMQ
jgi:hypothetical protein